MSELNDKINNNKNNDNNVNNINNDNDNIPCRCPKCFFDTINKIDRRGKLIKIILYYKCENEYEFKEEFNSLCKKSKIKIENIECKKCNNKKLKN